jgi:hypothetical protein
LLCAWQRPEINKSTTITGLRRNAARHFRATETPRHRNGNNDGSSQIRIGDEMTKEFLKGVTVLVAIVALAFVTAVAANAQSSNKAADQLVVDIPFAFSVDYKTLPAGEYAVQTIATAGDALLIQSADGKTSVLRPCDATERLKNRTPARLVFHRYGERYFLAEVWNGSDSAGRQLMKSQAELALERESAELASKGELAQSSYEKIEVLATQQVATIR